MSLKVSGAVFVLAMVAGLPFANAQVTVGPVSTITTTAQSNGTTLPFQRHIVRIGPAVAGQGELFAALQRQGTDGAGLDLFESQDEGQTWTEAMPIQDNSAERDMSDMLPDADGNGFSLVYGVEPPSSDFQPDPNSTVVYLHYTVAGGSLSIDQGPVTVFQPGSNQGYFRPSIAIDTTGAIHVTGSLLNDPGGVAEGSSTKPGVEPNYAFSWWESVSTNSGATWSTPAELATFGDSLGGGRVLAYGDNLMAIFDAYDVSQQGRYMTEPAGAGENWSAPQVFVSAGLYHAGAFSVTATPDGIVHLGYSDKPEEQLWYTAFNGTSWSTAQLIDSTGVWSNQPALSHDGNTLTYAWNHYVSDTDNIIEEETLPPGGSFTSPITVDSVQLFKGYTSAIEQFIDGEPVFVLWSQDPTPPESASNIQCAPISGITGGSSGTGTPDGGVSTPDAGMEAPDAGTGTPDAGTGTADAGTGSPVSFSDSFSECSATTEASLSSDWSLTGTWDCDSGHARAETAGTALAETAAMDNTTVSASVQLDSSNSAGVIGRASNGSFYAAVIESAGAVALLRVNNGTVTTVASVSESVALDSSYGIELVLTGISPVTIQVSFKGATVINTSDSSASALLSGNAGLYSGGPNRCQFADFTASGTSGASSSSPPPTQVTSFSDDFADCTATSIGPDWITTGTWYCETSEQARGQTAGGLALANANLPANQTVTARIELTEGGTGSGLVARANGGSFYLARMLESGSFEIDRVVGSTVTPLGSAPQTFTENSDSYRITLSVSQTSPVQLTGSVNGTVLITTTDNSADQLTSGSVGLYSGSAVRTQYYDFSATSP